MIKSLMPGQNDCSDKATAGEFTAYILSWDSVQSQGYLSDGKCTFLFLGAHVLDSGIMQSLGEGCVHMLVRCVHQCDGNSLDGSVQKASILRSATPSDGFRFLGLQKEDVRMMAGRLLIDGRFDEAATEYQKLIKVNKNDLETIKSLANTYIQLNKRRVAIYLLGEAVNSFDGSEAFELNMLLMSCLTEVGRYKEAISVIDRMLSRKDLDWKKENWLYSRRVTFENAIRKTNDGDIVKPQDVNPQDVIPPVVSSGFDHVIQDFCDIDVKKVDQAIRFVRDLPDFGFTVTPMHTQALSILERAKLYFQSPAYLLKCDCYRDILKMVESFEREFISRDSGNRLVGKRLLLMLQSLCSQVRGHLIHYTEEEVPITIDPQSAKCTIDNGLLSWTLRVVDNNESSPPIRSLSLSLVGRQDVQPITCECRHEDDNEDGMCVRLDFKPTEDELVNRCGELDVKVDYVKQIEPFLVDNGNLGLAFGESSKKMQFLVDCEERFDDLFNPYDGIKYPMDSFFVGRQDVMSELSRIFAQNSQGVGYILYGQHYCGKSTVMVNFLASLKKDPKFVVTLLDGQNWSSCPQKAFLQAVARKNHLEVSDDMLKLSADIAAFGHDVQLNGKTWVVGIDEFTKPYSNYYKLKQERSDSSCHEEREAISKYLDEIRSLLDEGIFNLLLIGQEDTAQFFDDPEFSNSVSRIKRRRLSFLSKDAVCEYAMVPVRNKDVRVDFYRGKSLDLIARWTGGSPWLSQKIMTKIFNILIKIKYPVVQELIVQMAVNGLMDDKDGDSLSKMDFEPFLSLRSCEFSDTTIEDFYHRFIKVAKEGVWVPLSYFSEAPDDCKKIAFLLEREIFERLNGNVRVKVKLFDRWLRDRSKAMGE